MLCPKCGYITFDELPSCPKCKKDWADISGKISGVGLIVEAPSFLVSTAAGQEGEDLLTASESSEVHEEHAYEGKGVGDDDDFDLILDELPDPDAAERDSDISIAPVPEDTPVSPEASGIEFQLDDSDEDSEGIELKAGLDISLDDEPSLPLSLEVDEKEEPGDTPLTVDLHDIDLSDLMESGETEEKHGVSGELGNDAEETGLDFASSNDTQGVPDLLGIDLSLDDDGLDLSLELDSGISSSAKKEDEAAIPDLGLSLDLDD